MILYFAPTLIAFTLLGVVVAKRLLDGEFTALQISMLERVKRVDRDEYERRKARYRLINGDPVKGRVLSMWGECLDAGKPK